MTGLKSQLLREHIEQNYPDAKLIRYDDPESDLSFYDSEGLGKVEGSWFPLSCYRDMKTGKLIVGGSRGIYHTYIEGETGVGKTTRFCMQSIRALSSTKQKPSFVVTDMHGEIIENLYLHLIKNGYTIRIINCDNPERSDTYNPLACIGEEAQREKTLTYNVVQGVRHMASLMQPVESRQDPIWDQGACAYVTGALYDKIEDLIDGKMPPQCLTIYNLIQSHYWLRRKIEEGYEADLFRIEHYKKKGPEALSVQKMIGVTNNAERTRASYFGVVENHYDKFGQPAMYALSSNSTIGIEEFIHKPTVIVIQSASTDTGDSLISLLVSEIYSKVAKIAKLQKNKRAPRDIHCFLDEFANCNIADGLTFIRMLTTSRKFGMFWHMFLQCDAQLDRKFDPQISNIIRANCTEIFMGSNDYITRERFARSCGFRTVESPASKVSPQTMGTETVPLITAELLNLTRPGYMYVKRRGCPLLKTYFEPFYTCPEFEACEDIDEVYPHNTFDYTTTRFYPGQAIEPPKAERERASRGKGIRGDSWIDYQATQEIRFDTDPREAEALRAALDEALSLLSDDEPDGTLDGEQGENRAKEDDFSRTLLQEMEEHVRREDESINHALMPQITMIPKWMKTLLFELCEFGLMISDDDLRDELPNSQNMLKFEILEVYLMAHDYKSKASWNKAVNREYEKIQEANLFPISILEIFQKAGVKSRRS